MQNYFLKCDISGIQPFIFNVPSKGATKELKSRSMYVEKMSDQCLQKLARLTEPKMLYQGGGNFYLTLNAEKEKLDDAIISIQKEYTTFDLFPNIAYIEDNESDIFKKFAAVNAVLQKTRLCRPVCCEKIKSEGERFHNPDNRNSLPQGANGMVPKKESGEIMDFSEIAAQSKGDAKIAALKLDVDNLGSYFQDRTENDYRKLSEKLAWFFNKKMEEVIKKSKFEKNIYVVFAGGDDCFLIGSWNVILDFAILFRKEFDLYLNLLSKEMSFVQGMSFSAGIVIVPEAYPMVKLAEEAELVLSASKKQKNKDSITCFGITMSWSDFEKSKEISQTLDQLIDKGESKALLQVLQDKTINPWIEKKSNNSIPSVWHLKYYLKKVLEENTNTVKKIFEDYNKSLLARYVQAPGTNPDIYPVAARVTELLKKSLKTE